VNILQRLGQSKVTGKRFNLTDLAGAMSMFTHNGNVLGAYGIQQTLQGSEIMPIGPGFNGFVTAVKACPPAFAAQLVRSLVLSQASFVFRNRRFTNTPGRVFTTKALQQLERPWPNGTTSDLLSAMEWHAGLAGNAYVYNRGGNKGLRLLNPAWVTVILGSEEDPTDAINQVDAEIAGYIYQPGGRTSGRRPRTMLPEEVAHWSPIPDPETPFVGMSWITPAIREIQADVAATDHRLKFFENGATPNLVVKGIPAASDEEFNRMVDLMEEEHAGVANAYRTLYLVNGADATVVGSTLQQLDLRSTLGSGETRISMLSRVPAAVLGNYDGLAGSSLNAGNFGQARRNFADGWLYPTLQSAAAALAPIVQVPRDADLWYDTADMPFIRDDALDLASVQAKQAEALNTLITAGYDPASAQDALTANDIQKLKHTGLVSVQLQVPGSQPDAPPAA
jgi:phage portal protein BeeE